jgi:hypothetical protein
MEEESKLKIIIFNELEILRTRLEESKFSWEIEKYENQISILEKVLLEAEIKTN